MATTTRIIRKTISRGPVKVAVTVKTQTKTVPLKPVRIRLK